MTTSAGSVRISTEKQGCATAYVFDPPIEVKGPAWLQVLPCEFEDGEPSKALVVVEDRREA